MDARFIDHEKKKVLAVEMSCPWRENREKKQEEKTIKYGPLRWELKQQFPGYDIRQYNIIIVICHIIIIIIIIDTCIVQYPLIAQSAVQKFGKNYEKKLR